MGFGGGLSPPDEDNYTNCPDGLQVGGTVILNSSADISPALPFPQRDTRRTQTHRCGGVGLRQTSCRTLQASESLGAGPHPSPPARRDTPHTATHRCGDGARSQRDRDQHRAPSQASRSQVPWLVAIRRTVQTTSIAAASTRPTPGSSTGSTHAICPPRASFQATSRMVTVAI